MQKGTEGTNSTGEEELHGIGIHSLEDEAFLGLLPVTEQFASGRAEIALVRLLAPSEAAGIAFAEVFSNTPTGDHK